MEKKLGVVVSLCLALAACLALFGCGGIDKTAYTGTWNLESGSDESLSAESIELMNSLGLEVTVVLNEDGSGSLNLFGEETELTWDAKSNTDGTVTLSGNSAALKLTDGKLVLEDSTGASMTFVKAEASGPASASASAASSASADEGSAASDGAQAGSDEAASSSAAE